MSASILQKGAGCVRKGTRHLFFFFLAYGVAQGACEDSMGLAAKAELRRLAIEVAGAPPSRRREMSQAYASRLREVRDEFLQGLASLSLEQKEAAWKKWYAGLEITGTRVATASATSAAATPGPLNISYPRIEDYIAQIVPNAAGSAILVRKDGTLLCTDGVTDVFGLYCPKYKNIKEIHKTNWGVALLKYDGTVECIGNTYPKFEQRCQKLKDVTSIVHNREAFGFLTKQGRVTCVGNVMFGGGCLDPLGAILLRNVVKIVANQDSFLALKSNGKVEIWGDLKHRLGKIPEKNIVDIASGSGDFGALTNDGVLHLFGPSKGMVRATNDDPKVDVTRENVVSIESAAALRINYKNGGTGCWQIGACASLRSAVEIAIFQWGFVARYPNGRITCYRGEQECDPCYKALRNVRKVVSFGDGVIAQTDNGELYSIGDHFFKEQAAALIAEDMEKSQLRVTLQGASP